MQWKSADKMFNRIVIENENRLFSACAKYNETALHTAAWDGYLDICQCLLRAGAEVTARDKVSIQKREEKKLKKMIWRKFRVECRMGYLSKTKL